MGIEHFLLIGILGLVVVALVVAIVWMSVQQRKPPNPDIVETTLPDLFEDFRRKTDALTSRYAEEFALVKFLERAEAEGRPIDPAQFKAGALNRANLLRIRQIEDAITNQVTTLTKLTAHLSHVSDMHIKYEGHAHNIKAAKEQISVEEAYLAALQGKLHELEIYSASDS